MTILIINEGHSLMPQQEELLQGKEVEKLLIPAKGLTKEEILSLAKELGEKHEEIVMVSPIPLLIKELALNGVEFEIFFNEQREKKELPNGKIISVVAKEGWELV